MKGREGMTRSHARGVVALILIVLAAEAAIFIAGDLKISVSGADSPPRTALHQDSSNRYAEAPVEKLPLQRENQKGTNTKLFRFDPNTASREEFLKLGLSSREASVIINYRNKGGKFRSGRDLEKIYTLSRESYLRIRDCVFIQPSAKIAINSASSAAGGEPPGNNSETLKDTSAGSGYTPLNTSELVSRNKLELNSADSAELVSLPGIGPFFASRILDYRRRLGGFVFPEQLMEVYGIDKERFSVFNSRIWADSTKIKRIKLSDVTAEQLSANPYIGAYAARSIIKFREQAGEKVINIALLVSNRIIREELAKILKYYLE